MENKKLACEIKPGDKIEALGGVFTVARAHVMGDTVSMIGTVGGVLSAWGHYNKMDEFSVITVH